MDDADRADLETQSEINRAILNTTAGLKGPSLIYCEDCDEPIDVNRRLSLPGVRTCVYCQTDRERRRHV